MPFYLNFFLSNFILWNYSKLTEHRDFKAGRMCAAQQPQNVFSYFYVPVWSWIKVSVYVFMEAFSAFILVL